MKKLILSTITSLLLLSFSFQTYAQRDTASKPDPSLRGQYLLMLSKSRTLDGYKLVNPSRLNSFYQNSRDSVSTAKKQLSNARSKIADHEKTIGTLKNDLAAKQSSLETSNARLDEISFLGIPFSKAIYNIIVWGLIILLAIALSFVIIRSAKHIHEAKYRRTLYDEIAAEYQNYKMKANEKEKKLARELQDERNKLEELKTRGR